MMKKCLSSIFLVAVLLGLLAGCTNKHSPTYPAAETTQHVTTQAPTEASTVVSAEAPTETPTEASTEPTLEQLDLKELYNQGMAVLAQMGGSAPVLFPETNLNYLNNFYPGIADVEMKQFYAGVAPVTNAPFEIILVEVADEANVQTMLDIFHARASKGSENSIYPENAEAWINKCRITSRGCYVFLAVLMDPCEIPAEFILD